MLLSLCPSFSCCVLEQNLYHQTLTSCFRHHYLHSDYSVSISIQCYTQPERGENITAEGEKMESPEGGRWFNAILCFEVIPWLCCYPCLADFSVINILLLFNYSNFPVTNTIHILLMCGGQVSSSFTATINSHSVKFQLYLWLTLETPSTMAPVMIWTSQ